MAENYQDTRKSVIFCNKMKKKKDPIYSFSAKETSKLYEAPQ